MGRPAAAASVEEELGRPLLDEYLDTLSLIERLHRLLLDVVKDEFERAGRIDINSVQALLLFNIGDEVLTAGDLKTRGYYQGSNVSYNLKKLVEAGYIHHERCSVDRRSVRIRLTDRGREIHDFVGDIFQRHAAQFLTKGQLCQASFEKLNETMQRLEQYWRDQIRFIY